jgi:predicted nucleotidyltransferase
VRLSLFGSAARGDTGPDSDVDLIEEGTLKPRVQKIVETEVVPAF